MKPNNPFVLAGYKGPAYFCDRVKETKRLCDAIKNESNVTLLSPRRYSKTGLIRNAFYKLERDGEYHTISCNEYVLTADNIGDVSNVDFSTLNEYVDISVFVNGEEYVIDLRVVPNTDGLEIIMEGVRREVSASSDGGTEVDYYYFVAYGNGLIESCDFDLRNDETAWRDYMEYEAVRENDELLFAINQNGMTFYYMQSDETYEGYTVVTEYHPGREEQTTSYTLSLGDNMTVRFEVFGNDYAMMFQTNPRTGAMELGGTVKVEINAENNTFAFANTTFTIGENNVLTLGVPDEEPVEIVEYFGDEITFVLFEGGTGYYMMNGEPVMMLDGWSYVYSADQEAPVALKISMSGDELVFVIWEIDGKWHEGDEPDFSNADIRLFFLDGEEVTLYCWAGTGNSYLQFGDAALIQAYYDADADTIRYYAPSGNYVFLINGTELILDDGSDPIPDPIDEPEETVTLTFKYFIDEQMVEELTQSDEVPSGTSLDSIAELIGSTTEFEEGGDTYRLVGVYYDPAKKQAVTAKDVVTEDLVLYFFMQTVAAGGN